MQNLPVFLENALSLLERELPEHQFAMWIKQLKFDLENQTLFLLCPNNFVAGKIKRVFLKDIEKAISASRNGDGPLKIKLKIERQQKPSDHCARPVQLSLPMLSSKFTGLRKNFTFDDLIVGPFNEFAYHLIREVSKPQQAILQPVFLVSQTGLGKSHLQQALARYMRESQPASKALYITATDFSAEFVSACKEGKLDSFKKRFKECDLLVIDDVHFLEGKSKTQIELHGIIDSLLNNDKKIVFSSSVLPHEILKLDFQLLSRFTGSIISKIDPPDFNSRVKIIKKCTNGHQISHEVAEYLASVLTSDVRQLKSGIFGLLTRHLHSGLPLNLENAMLVAKDLVQNRKVTIDKIMKTVAQEFGIKVSDLSSKSRARQVLRPRQIAMSLCRKHTDLTIQTIGTAFGGRQHATVLHSLEQAEEMSKTMPSFKAQMEMIEKKLQNCN